MRNIRFSCYLCGQHLVAEGEWSGLDIHCPGCGNALTIPAEYSIANAEAKGAREKAGERELRAARSQADALAAQRDSFATEIDHLKGMMGMAELAREALQNALRESNGSLAEKEESIQHIQARLEGTQADLAHARRLVIDLEEQIRTGRAKFQGLAGENQQISAALAKQEQLLAEGREEIRAAHSAGEKLDEGWKETRDELSRALAACSSAEAERDKLKAELSVEFGLVEFLQLKEKAGTQDLVLADGQEKLGSALRELGDAKTEIRRAHERRMRLELELAACKDALSESKLEQDNDILRGLVARLNEELKQYRPLSRRAAKKLAAKARSWRNDTSFFRWPWSRRLVMREAQQNPSL